MVITKPEQIPDMMREWPANTSHAPAKDDENARLDTIMLAEWWLSTVRDMYTASIVSEPTASTGRIGWHFWFELRHRDYDKPCRCFRVLVQHWKPPRVYQLQFPMEVRELPVTDENRIALRALIMRTEESASRNLPRDNAEDKTIKSINMSRRFSQVQFAKFGQAVVGFVDELNRILTRPN